MVAAELDSFDGRKDPERCTMLVNQLRVCQDKVLTVVQKIMEEAIPGQRANRDFRVKFPDDVLQDSLAGQLWFGAEACIIFNCSVIKRRGSSDLAVSSYYSLLNAGPRMYKISHHDQLYILINVYKLW